MAKTLAKMVILKLPSRLHGSIIANAYSERHKQNRLFMFDASRKKIGKQCFPNRLSQISKKMKFEWTNCDIHLLRQNLKKCFFPYYFKKSIAQ